MLAQLSQPYGITSANGTAYVTDSGHNLIRMVSPSGQVSILAGIPGYSGYNGDGLPGTSSLLNNPTGIAVSSSGYVYFADTNNNAIRMISPSGVVSTVVGYTFASSSLPINYGGDGGPAIYAKLNAPRGVEVASNGNIYIADTANNAIRMVYANMTITTIAGSGCSEVSGCKRGSAGDGGPATSAHLDRPSGVAVASNGNVYIADTGNNVIRVIYPNGTINTFAGTITSVGYSGDGGAATSALLNGPTSVAIASNGSIYIADNGNNAIRIVSPSGIITTLAGTGCNAALGCASGYSGDGGLATNAMLNNPTGVWFRNNGNSLLIADTSNNVIRSVSSANIISTTIGYYNPDTYVGVMSSALSAYLDSPAAVSLSSGSIYIAEARGQTIKMLAKNGSVVTIAGNGTAGYSGDGGLAVNAQVNSPTDIVAAANGNIYFADTGNNLVRVIYPNGTINTVAGYCIAVGSTCRGGYTGDGVPATTALLNFPSGISVQSNGDIYIADMYNSKIRKVASNGTISTVAGSFTAGYSGDGGPAYLAKLNRPSSISVAADGTIYFADTGNNVIRMIATNGTIGTVAGASSLCLGVTCPGYTGDGIATGVCLKSPTRVVASGNGEFYFSDSGNNLVRRVSNGLITTVAGYCQCNSNCVAGYSGDNGPATNALLNYPTGLYYAGNNLLYVADSGNNVIRRFTSGSALSATMNPLLLLAMLALALLL